jgi:signal transduction histidine kinase
VRFFRQTLRIRMALLYGGLVLLVGVALLFTTMVLLDRSIARIPFFNTKGEVIFTDSTGSTPPVEPSALGAQARHDSRDYLLHTGLIYFGIIVVIGAAGGYLLARQALRPIAQVTRTARQLSTETLDQRIDLGGPDDELRELADTFDEMLARLDAAFDGQRRFVANASHELRTPLSVIRTELDVTLSDPNASQEELRRMGEVALAATERAQRLVGSLLILARLQSGHRTELEVREPVDLSTLVRPVVGSVAAEAAARSISIDTETSPARTLGDPRLLERLIGNLVENAVRHNVDGGWLRVSCGEGPERAWLHVANGGQIIAATDVDGLFEPFRRGGSKARTATRGSGLGLSIVRLIVEAHHGRLQAAAPPFGGLAVRIELPLAGPGDAMAVPELLAAQRVRQRGAGQVDLPRSRA